MVPGKAEQEKHTALPGSVAAWMFQVTRRKGSQETPLVSTFETSEQRIAEAGENAAGEIS